jgi:hypothetical protein
MPIQLKLVQYKFVTEPEEPGRKGAIESYGEDWQVYRHYYIICKLFVFVVYLTWIYLISLTAPYQIVQQSNLDIFSLASQGVSTISSFLFISLSLL